MADLTANYLGLTLRNPIIASSSGLSNSKEKIYKLDHAGVGAIVLKSLFEEQINAEANSLLENEVYPEAEAYIKSYTKSNSVGEYIQLIKDAKEVSSVPIIASINCHNSTEWIDFAKKIEEAGADALEVNVFFLATDKEKAGTKYEDQYLALAEKLRDIISIPIAFKLGANFTNPVWMVNQLYLRKINAVVLFNRFYQPDIDIENLKFTAGSVFSNPTDFTQSLRWMGIISSEVKEMSLSNSTGVHNGETAIKLLLAGASACQVCSVLYKNGLKSIPEMVRFIESWMEQKNYNKLSDFIGKMNSSNIGDPGLYERSQFMKYFSSHE